MPETKFTPDEAYNILVANVHAPVFFEKLARVYGISPQTPEEAREVLLMAGKLRNAHEQEQVKQASVNKNFYAEARQDLDTTLTKQGFQLFAEEDNAVKQAEVAIKNPVIKEAALVFGQYMQQQTKTV